MGKTSVYLPDALLETARELDINLSGTLRLALLEEVRRRRGDRVGAEPPAAQSSSGACGG